MATVIGSTRCSELAPATAARVTRMASGPYATEVSASRERAESPSTGVICSLATSLMRNAGPTTRRRTALAV